MNGPNFMSWIENRLVPTFKTVYPGKKMILVLDNAKYHHVKDENYIDVNSLNRKDLITTLQETCELTEITVERPS